MTVNYSEGARRLHGRTRPVSVISTSDTGSGICEKNEKRLFDPFFTTKEKGTGLGLPIASRIIDKARSRKSAVWIS